MVLGWEALNSSNLPMLVFVGAERILSLSDREVLATSFRTLAYSLRFSSGSVSVGSIIRASGTIRGKYVVGACCPESRIALATSLAEIPVARFNGEALTTNSCFRGAWGE